MLAAANTLATDSNGLTALHRCMNKEEAEALIKLGLNVEAKSNAGWTPLHSACREARLDPIQTLIAAGADVNAKNANDWTPLHYACGYGRLEVAQTLIAAGADVNVKTNAGATPLHSACTHGHLEVAQTLIAAGADVHAKSGDDWTPLHWACTYGRLEVAQALIAAGADLNVKTNTGTTPLALCKTDEMRALFTPKKPDTAKTTPLPSAIAPAKTVSADDIRSFGDMLTKAGAMMSAAKIQGFDGQDLVRATSLYETALAYVQQSVKNLSTN